MLGLKLNHVRKRGTWYDEHALQWRHNGHGSVSNHQPHDCLPSLLYRRRSKKALKLRVTGICAGNSPGTGKFPAQRASYAENFSIWRRHHGRRTLGISPGDTPVILDISLWEIPRPDNRTIIQAGMAWFPHEFKMVICIQRQVNAECDWSKFDTLPLQQLGESALPGEKAHHDRTKMMVDNKTSSEGRKRSFIYFQCASIETDLDFRQLWGKQSHW